MNHAGKPLRIALLGGGVVGSQVARMLVEDASDIAARVGREVELVGVGVRRLEIERPGIDRKLLTNDPMALVTRGDIDLVVEVIGGIEPARSLILAAFQHGASVITANKALLASDGGTLFDAASAAGVDLYFEASVAGAIPIVRPLRESLVGDAIKTVMGIVNGTTNYILDKMHTEGMGFADALAQAQALGYAEADPTADVEGYDAAAKAALLAGLAFHSRVRLEDVDREGMTQVTADDVAAAKSMDCVIKLLARCSLSDDGTIAVGVHPTMVPVGHPLASVSGAYNAIFVESHNAGQLMFMGPGAGGSPTAAAVMGDVITAARNRVRGVAGPGESAYERRAITPPGEVASRYYVSLDVRDEPGVLAKIAACFAEHGISLQAVRQNTAAGGAESGEASLGVMTHVTRDRQIAAAVAQLRRMPDVRERIRVLRVEGLA